MNQVPQNDRLILPFAQVRAADLPRVGGKGANLGEMTAAGFPVPPGFCLTTAAFRQFMAAAGNADEIYTSLEALAPDDVESVRAAGRQIREHLRAVPPPPPVQETIAAAWQALGNEQAYAVRSSATAEDLPTASFAGQQDTFLNVRGLPALLESVRNCWISLFTDRAILYRARNGFSHRQVQLCVVVQRMVLPEVSGVLFTADPVSGRRAVLSINASFGLGEALVAGLVSPDLYLVDKRDLRVVETQIADKRLAIRPLPGGGTFQEELDGDRRTTQVLGTEQIRQLAALGARVETHYGAPQDIEWAMEGDHLYLLQARPLTTLYPLPEGLEADPLHVLVSFGAVQGILDPMTPLGHDTIRAIFAGAGRLFGRQLTIETQSLIHVAGERLWLDVSTPLQSALGRSLARGFSSLVEPGVEQALTSLMDDSRLRRQQPHAQIKTLLRLARFAFMMGKHILRAWRRPEHRRTELQRQMEQQIAALQALADQANTFPQRLALFQQVYDLFPYVIPHVFSAVLAGLIPFVFLSRLARQPSPGGEANLVMRLARGLPHNVTTEMDLHLWHTAQAIRADAAALTHFTHTGADSLAGEYLAGRLPAPAQTAVANFLARYGVRGTAEIDIGRPRWQEDPTPIMQILGSYLGIEDETQAPDAVFGRGERDARQAAAQMEAIARKTHGGRLKAWAVRALIRRFRALAGLRESPKFYIIRVLAILRQQLLASGRDMAAAGRLDRADDLFFLYLSELESLARDEPADWTTLVAKRREAYQNEMHRQQIPRLMLSDGRTFYQGLHTPPDAGENVLVGSPVSAGVVEGLVRVVRDPLAAQLEAGEILVCPGTDPAWTPLFLAAGGLVTEVGGMMTHGSVVAREYGIPAVVGVDQATTRLRTGQRVRVEGNLGYVELLEDDEAKQQRPEQASPEDSF